MGAARGVQDPTGPDCTVAEPQLYGLDRGGCRSGCRVRRGSRLPGRSVDAQAVARVYRERMLPTNTRPLARLALLSFLLTFVAARVVSYLMRARRMAGFYLHVYGTHVHHLNYGI